MSTLYPVFANQVPALEFGDASNLFSISDSPPLFPLEVNPGLENTNINQIQNPTNHTPGFKDKPPNRNGSIGVYSDKDERRKSRKLSNRESAQRSRRKKQKHLENVKSELNQLKISNRELENQLRYVLYHSQQANMENERLRKEHDVLHHKLLNLIRQALMFRQIQQSSGCATWSCINSTIVTTVQQKNPSMIRDRVV